MKEINVKVGLQETEREKRFVGSEIGKWSGFSDDREWLLEAKIYKTQKGNLAVYLINQGKATLLTNRRAWSHADYFHKRTADLIIGTTVEELKGKLPEELIKVIEGATAREESPVEYLDI